jgi:hypothetical protein
MLVLFPTTPEREKSAPPTMPPAPKKAKAASKEGPAEGEYLAHRVMVANSQSPRFNAFQQEVRSLRPHVSVYIGGYCPNKPMKMEAVAKVLRGKEGVRTIVVGCDFGGEHTLAKDAIGYMVRENPEVVITVAQLGDADEAACDVLSGADNVEYRIELGAEEDIEEFVARAELVARAGLVQA